MNTFTHGGARANSGGSRRGAGRKSHVMLRNLRAGTIGRVHNGRGDIVEVWRIVDTPQGLTMYDAHGRKITITHEDSGTGRKDGTE
jgi:hypothetical protein